MDMLHFATVSCTLPLPLTHRLRAGHVFTGASGRCCFSSFLRSVTSASEGRALRHTSGCLVRKEGRVAGPRGAIGGRRRWFATAGVVQQAGEAEERFARALELEALCSEVSHTSLNCWPGVTW